MSNEDSSTPKMSPHKAVNYNKTKYVKNTQVNNTNCNADDEDAKEYGFGMYTQLQYSLNNASKETVKYDFKEAINDDIREDAKNFINEPINNIKNIDLEKMPDYSITIPNIKKLLNYEDLNQSQKYKSKIEGYKLNKEYPKDYQKNQHQLRIKNAELRKELSEKIRDKRKVEKEWSERTKYSEQTKRLLKSRKDFIAKYENELNKQIKERNTLNRNISGILYI